MNLRQMDEKSKSSTTTLKDHNANNNIVDDEYVENRNSYKNIESVINNRSMGGIGF
jgi:hypothetical protein